MGSGTLAFHGFSTKGDLRWYRASHWTRYGPAMVITLFVGSCIQIVLGAIWTTQIGGEMEIPKIIQPIVIPGLSFFHAPASIHLHWLLRNDPPWLVMSMSSAFTFLWGTSSILYLASCGSDSAPLELRKTECSTAHNGGVAGPSPGVWAAFVGFGLVMTLLYIIYGLMAAYVWHFLRQEKAERERNGEADIEIPALPEDPEEAERVREMWRHEGRYGF